MRTLGVLAKGAVLLLAVAALGLWGVVRKPQADAPTTGVGLAPDFAAAMEKVRLAFQPHGNGWSAVGRGYALDVDAAGETVTARDERSNASALKLGTPVLTRGERGLGKAGAWTRTKGQLARFADGWSESLSNGPEGMEQSWTFVRAPEGSGALIARIPVRGMALKARTATGIHFADAGSGLGIRYGHATWVDAQGRRTPVPASLEHE